MFILHCMKKSTWESVKDKEYYGSAYIKAVGFLHCSSIEYMWRVAPMYEGVKDELVLLCIATSMVEPTIQWERGESNDRQYPHIYGELNLSAVVDVYPFLRDERGKFKLNPDLMEIIDGEK